MTKVTAFLLPEEDANAAHITMVATANGVSLVFSGAYNTLVIQDQLRIADEYIATARVALNERRFRAFAANATTASELLAKSELLSLPEERVAKSKKHGTVQSFYNQWAQLGNTEQRFADLLNRLARLRDPARYERSDLGLEADEAEKLMEDLDGMREHVEEVRPRRSFEDDAARSHNAIAARDITAGEIIGTGDYIFFK